MRNRKNLCVAICVFLIIALLSGCSSKNSNMRDDFVEYYSDIFDENVFMTDSNTQMAVMSLEKENTSSNRTDDLNDLRQNQTIQIFPRIKK